jgi:hypothetical protein
MDVAIDEERSRDFATRFGQIAKHINWYPGHMNTAILQLQ